MNAEPPRASGASTTKPVRIDMHLGTPACDMRHGRQGQLVGITNSYCILLVHDEQDVENKFSVVPWQHVAVGNVAPAKELLPDRWDERERLDSYAVLFRELTAVQPEHMTPHLEKTLQELYLALTKSLSEKGN